MDNPAGYLYRVGQSKARRLLRWRRSTVLLPPEPAGRGSPPEFKPGLARALAIVLVHGFGWDSARVRDLDLAEPRARSDSQRCRDP